MSKDKNLLRASISVDQTRYRKDDFAIILCSIYELKDNSAEPQYSSYNQITIKGTMPSLKEDGTLYNIVAEYVHDEKYGDQYNLVSIVPSIEFGENDPKGKKQFLLSIFTELQVQEMYEALDDPFTALKEGNAAELVKIKGCGMKNAAIWSDKFNRNLGMAKIFTELEDYELSNNMIEKLIDKYKSPELVIEKVKNNPYILATEVKGIGFKKADKIALAGGLDEYGPERIGAFIVYYLEECGENGLSWIESDHLCGAILDALGEEVPDINISLAIQSLGEKLWWSEDKERIGLRRYYDIEHKIAEELIRLRDAESRVTYDNWQEQVNKLEQSIGIEFTDEQRAGIESGLNNNVTVITGLAGCVDCDTEFFDGTKWKKISEFEEGDMVLQYNSDGTSELVKPLLYYKHPKEYLWHFETKYGLDQCLSENHNCVLISPKGVVKKEQFSSIMKRHNERKFYDRFICAFTYNGPGINLSDDMIRMCVACSADGGFNYNIKHSDALMYNRARFNLTKPRKIQRIIELAQKAGLKYEVVNYNKTKQINSKDIYVYMPFRFKVFPPEWYQCSLHQKRIIAEEVMFWDARYEKTNDYSTTIKENADFVQFVFSSIGIRTNISIQDRRGQTKEIDGKQYKRKSIEYTIHAAHSPYTKITSDKRKGSKNTEINQYKTKDGYEYCFSVPSEMLILRRNNKIFITGNSGKSTVVRGILSVLKSYDFCQVALSGRAASRLTEITGKEGATIHRTLGYPLGDKQGFVYHDENPLPYDLYILDEISMVDSFLLYYLLRAIPSGSKVYLLGDVGQLESIGAGNIAHDIIDSGEIATVFLTKIHRQAAKSAIVTESIKVRNSQQLVDKDWVGTETRGELQDLTIKCFSDKSNTYHEIVRTFKRYYESDNFDIMETQIIVPIKSRGDANTRKLNNAIQEIYNPDPMNHKMSYQIYKDGATYTLREGDKVINKVNNYKTNPFIYNGNMGILERIAYDEDMDDEVMVINFKAIGQVKVPKKYWKNIELAYAITVHSDQGSEHDNIIFGLDFASYSLLSKELVYTGITRARKKCELIAQTGALRMAIATEGVSKKQTHLIECIQEVAHPKLTF